MQQLEDDDHRAAEEVADDEVRVQCVGRDIEDIAHSDAVDGPAYSTGTDDGAEEFSDAESPEYHIRDQKSDDGADGSDVENDEQFSGILDDLLDICLKQE